MPRLPRFATGQVAPILHIRPGARRRRERDALRHRDCTVIIHTYAACVQKHRQPHAYSSSDGRGVPVPPRDSRAQGVLCRRSCVRQVSKCAAYITDVVHTARMRLAGCRWLTSGKPPPVAYVRDYSDILTVRFDRDYGPRPSVAYSRSCL